MLAGATTVTLTVSTDNDEMGERSGMITVRITTGAGYTVGTPSRALVTVFDNDTPAARISAGPSPIIEGVAATFRVTLGSAAPASGLTISVGVTESGSYIASSVPTAVFIAGGATTVTLTVLTADDGMGERSGSITVRITTGAGYTVGTPSTALVTVLDNDTPAARISAGPSPIIEGVAATFRVTLGSAAPASGLTISVDVTESGSYIASSVPTAVFIAGGATTVTLAVSTADDNLDEPDGIITAELTTGAGYTVGTPNTALVTVNDDDVLLASISAGSLTITEGADATFTVTLSSAAPAGGLTISVGVTDSGSYIDEPAPTAVFIAGGATTVTLAVSTEDDTTNEPDGIITAELTAGAGYTVGTPNTALVTVNDDDVAPDPDAPVASISAAPTTITEGEVATFRVTLGSAAPAGGLTISVGVTESGSYISGSAPATVVIAEGATTGTLTVSTADDNLDEPAGIITAELTAGAGYAVGTLSTALVTVNDNDDPSARISAAPTTITEGEVATFRVTLSSAAPADGLTISVGVTESGSYITGSVLTTVFIAAGARTGTLTVLTDNDEMGERSGIITVRITTGAGYTVGTPSRALVTVFDNDTPAARISAGPSPIIEGVAATFRVTLGSAAPASGLTISVGVTESGSYIASSVPTAVFIAGGATTVTLTVLTADDGMGERSGSITVRITTGAGYTVGTPSTALVTVLDNDTPAARISAGPSPIIEGVAATFRVTLGSAAPASGLTISVDVTESGSYIASSVPTAVFIAGGATTVTLAVSTADDNLDEPDGIITAELTTGAGYTVGTPNTALVTVNDDDVLLASISAGSLTITEGADATFTVTLSSAAPAGGLTISVGVTDSGSYIDEPAPTAVFIAGGATTVTLAVSTEDDTTNEPDGIITAELTAGAGYTVGTPNTALVTVNDDDVAPDPDAPVASISAAPTTITEGEVATFRVTLGSAAPAGGLTISVGVTESGSYISGSAPATVVIAEGATTGTLTVSTADDNLDEPAGIITAELTAGAGYAVGTLSTALVTVNDNDDPSARISAAPTTITEGDDATFRVTLSSAAPADGLTISVGVTESGSYITGSVLTTVFIAAGARTGTLTVLTDNDEMGERSGIITVRITTGAGYTVGTPSRALVTVFDNDTPAARISAGPSPIIEGVAATFRVTLGSAAPASGLTISVGVTESGSYIASSVPTAVFIAGGATTVTLTVLTADDGMGERSGSITVRITTGAGYTVGTPSTALVTVLDNDTPAARISAGPSPIIEGVAATFRVTLGSAAPASGLTISVDVTESGSYIASSVPTAVFIAGGATTVTLAVSTADDNLDEPDGIITAELTTGAGYTVGTPNTALVTVNDDDVLLASISAGSLTITEGADATFTVTLSSAAPAGGLTISVGVTDSGSYIDEPAPTAVFIAGGATTVTLAVSTEDDTTNEPDGIITAELTAGAGYTVGTPNTALVTVNDDDVAPDPDAPVASISAAPTTITEGEVATFRVTLGSAAPAGGLTISVGVTESGSYISGSAPATVVIAEGATTGTLTVSTADDNLDEPAGIITAELTAGAATRWAP